MNEDELGPGPRVIGLMCDELRVKCGRERCEWEGERSGLRRHWEDDCGGVEVGAGDSVANATEPSEVSTIPEPR